MKIFKLIPLVVLSILNSSYSLGADLQPRSSLNPLVLLDSRDLATAQHVLNFEPYDPARPFIIARHLGPNIWKSKIRASQKGEMKKKTLWDTPPVAGFSNEPNSPRVDWSESANSLPSYIQHQGDEIGFYISLSDLKTQTDAKGQSLYSPVRGGGPHMTVGKDLSAFPWANANGQLEMETEAAVSFVETSGGFNFFRRTERPFEQLSFILYLKDTESNSVMAFVFNFFDSRGVYNPSVQNDTSVDFLSAPLDRVSTHFLTLAADSAPFQTKPMKRRLKFHIALTEQNLLNAINAINAEGSLTSAKLSLDPKKYMLTSVNVFFELPNYVPKVTTNAGVSIKGMKVQISNTASTK